MHWEGWTYTLELAGLVLGLIAITIVVLAWQFRREQKQLHAVPRSRIGELVEGQRVRVVGTAVATGEQTSAPHTGTTCLACHAWQYSGPDGNDPDPIDRVVPFRVRDATGTIDVVVKHVKLHLAGGKLGAPQFGAKLIARAGIDIYEDRLEADQPVAVTGYALRGDDGTLHLTGTEADPLVIANVGAALV